MRGQNVAPDQRCIAGLRELKALELAARSRIAFRFGFQLAALEDWPQRE